MRIPLIRSGGDESPYQWWEWLFYPIMMPLIFIFLLVMAIFSVPYEFVFRLQQQREEKKLKPRLVATGRFLDWSVVEAKLQAGEGTLIVEHLSPKGPIREWWVENDLIASAPVPLPVSLRSAPSTEQLQSLREFAKACMYLHTDLMSGSAKLTEVPIPLARRIDLAKYAVVNLGEGLMTAILLSTGRKLATKYPSCKVVTLVTWLGEPIMFVGDAETVFLPDAEV